MQFAVLLSLSHALSWFSLVLDVCSSIRVKCGVQLRHVLQATTTATTAWLKCEIQKHFWNITYITVPRTDSDSDRMNSAMNNPQVAPCPIRMDTSVVALVITITITITIIMNMNVSVNMSASVNVSAHTLTIWLLYNMRVIYAFISKEDEIKLIFSFSTRKFAVFFLWLTSQFVSHCWVLHIICGFAGVFVYSIHSLY